MMRAGYSRQSITPPLGTHLAGFGGRDVRGGATAIHDDLYVRTLYVECDGQAALLAAFDLLFCSREEGDRFKGALGRALDLTPRQILLNFSHTHVGAALGTWGYAGYFPLVDPLYVEQVQQALVNAAQEARDRARPVSLQAGVTRTRLPVSRRKLNARGQAEWRPDPDAPVCDQVPVALFRDENHSPVCLLFSAACHPSTTGGHVISADYPGVTTARLDQRLGAPVSMFLQGCAGDTKARPIADGIDPEGGPSWRSGTWDDVDAAGRMLADEVASLLHKGLRPITPRVRAFLADMAFPLQPPPPREELLRIAAHDPFDLRRLWAHRQLDRLERSHGLPAFAPVMLQAIQLGADLRLLALEGEPTAPMARLLQAPFPEGVTFALGYSNSQGLYLPAEAQLPQGGYEVESAYEYGFPANLAPGYEAVLQRTLADFARQGLDAG